MKLPLPLACAALLMGCASSFRPINREALSYQQATLSPGLDFEYNREALRESGNAKYHGKSVATRNAIVAVKLRNKTDRPLDLGADLQFFAGVKPVAPSGSDVALRVRQKTGAYAFYLFGAPINFFGSRTRCDGYDCDQDFIFIPVGLIIAPVLMAINMSISSSANDAFRKEIREHDLFGKTLPPGEELSGYLVFPNTGSGALFARLKTDTTQPPPSAAVPEWEDAPPARARDFR
jgi:hypothetical protein